MELFRFGFGAMGCSCEIVAVSPSKAAALAGADAAIAEISRIERKYSRYLSDSVVSGINAQAGTGRVDCDEETMSLLRHASNLYEQSGGLFDLTSGVLRRAWDFDRQELPERGKLESLLELVGWDKVECEDRGVRLARRGMEIDLGGIGKEYASDRAAEILFSKGIRHGYVNLAGDIRIVGLKPDGEPWSIGVRDPRNEEKMMASVPMYRGALATSGDYERFIEVGGRRYCHILDPRTGYPPDFWRSVTVIAPSALEAGSCTTITMLKGESGIDYLDASGLMYLAVDCSGKLYHKN